MTAIELVDVTKRYGAVTVLDHLHLTVPERSITALLGASGSGKTTTLRLVAGFERLDGGTLTIGGVLVDDTRRFVRPQRRRIGYVAQDGALFPHLSVAANIGFGLRRAERSRVAEMTELVGLRGLEGRYPHQLSGGQQQRVALARALAIQPAVVLLDEPFSSLDAALRDSLRREVIEILRSTGTTAILVTHDRDEALSSADEIVVLDGGEVVATGTPRCLYEHPPALAAARILGAGNLVPAELAADRAVTLFGDIAISPPLGDVDRRGRTPGWVVVRPEQVRVEVAPAQGSVAARVVDARYHGPYTTLRIEVLDDAATVLDARVGSEQLVEPGQAVWVGIDGPVHPLAGDGRQSDPVTSTA